MLQQSKTSFAQGDQTFQLDLKKKKWISQVRLHHDEAALPSWQLVGMRGAVLESVNTPRSSDGRAGALVGTLVSASAPLFKDPLAQMHTCSPRTTFFFMYKHPATLPSKQ